MKWIVSITCSGIIVWISSILLGSHVQVVGYDKELGMKIPLCGYSCLRMKEGAALSCYGRYGLNASVGVPDACSFYFLHGDSFIEAFQVSDTQKPDFTLSRYLGDAVSVFGIGRSGAGLPSMISRAVRYEACVGVPVAHLFFVASGIRNDVYEDGFVGVKELPERQSAIDNRIWMNRLYLNFLPEIRCMVLDLVSRVRGLFRADSTVALQSKSDRGGGYFVGYRKYSF